VKTTLEIPDDLFRAAKATAARRGQTLKQFVTDAMQEKLSSGPARTNGDPPWMKLFGAGKKFAASIREIDAAIEKKFENVDSEVAP
jgi:hypothetical protein